MILKKIVNIIWEGTRFAFFNFELIAILMILYTLAIEPKDPVTLKENRNTTIIVMSAWFLYNVYFRVQEKRSKELQKTIDKVRDNTRELSYQVRDDMIRIEGKLSDINYTLYNLQKEKQQDGKD